VPARCVGVGGAEGSCVTDRVLDERITSLGSSPTHQNAALFLQYQIKYITNLIIIGKTSLKTGIHGQYQGTRERRY
jgi:hypothetical protein